MQKSSKSNDLQMTLNGSVYMTSGTPQGCAASTKRRNALTSQAGGAYGIEMYFSASSSEARSGLAL